jgi:para-nitrobenzyl esterase
MKLFLIENPRLVRSFLGLPRIRNIETWNSVVSHRSNTWKLLAVDQPARELSLNGRKNVYAYRFDWDDEPRKFGVNLSDLLGAAHAFEIPFVMGNFEEDTLTKYILSRKNMEEVKNLSNTMMSYWAEFAYTGAPGKGRKGNQIEWRAWNEISPENSKYIIFDSKTDRGIRMTSNAITKESLLLSNIIYLEFSGDISFQALHSIWLPLRPFPGAPVYANSAQ